MTTGGRMDRACNLWKELLHLQRVHSNMSEHRIRNLTPYTPNTPKIISRKFLPKLIKTGKTGRFVPASSALGLLSARRSHPRQ